MNPLVLCAAQQVGVDGEARALDGAHIVEGVAARARKIGIREGGGAARRVGVALEGAPGVLDEGGDGLAGP